MRTLKVDDANNLIVTETLRERASSSKGSSRRGLSTETTLRQTTGTEELKSIKLTGRWELTEEHDLILHVSGMDSRFFGKSIILRGRIVKLGTNNISFRVRQSDTLSGLRTGNIELSGNWQADPQNRLSFRVSKASGREEVLTFNGKWDIGTNNYIEYRFRETHQKTQTKQVHRLVLRGWWQIGSDRLVYRLHKEKPGSLVFRASLQSTSLRAQEGRIKYQLGVEIERDDRFKKEQLDLSIFGQWKVNRDLSLSFWVKFGNKNIESARLNVKTVISEGAFVEFETVFASGRSPKLDITFTRKLVPDTMLFLRLSRMAGDNRISGGVTVRF